MGNSVRKFFPSYGCYKGSIHSNNTGASEDKIVQMKYIDGDCEDISLQELAQIKAKASIPICMLGFQFINKFGGTFFSGEVI